MGSYGGMEVSENSQFTQLTFRNRDVDTYNVRFDAAAVFEQRNPVPNYNAKVRIYVYVLNEGQSYYASKVINIQEGQDSSDNHGSYRCFDYTFLDICSIPYYWDSGCLLYHVTKTWKALDQQKYSIWVKAIGEYAGYVVECAKKHPLQSIAMVIQLRVPATVHWVDGTSKNDSESEDEDDYGSSEED